MQPNDGKPVTLKDIADLAGVSISTVSRSLNGISLINEDTRKRIQAIADDLGFEFNASARGLVTKRIGTVGIILPSNYDHLSVSMYHSTLHAALRNVLEKNDFDLIVAFLNNRFSGQDNIRRLVTRKKVDGMIIIQPAFHDDAIDFLKARGIPFVFSHYPPEPGIDPEIDIVYPDNEHGGYLAGRHLARLGKRKVFCISGGPEREHSLRYSGLQRGLTEGGIQFGPEDVLYGDMSMESGYRAITNFRQSLRNYDAVVAFTDLIAIGAIQALKDLHFQVPDDIAVIGYDDTDIAAGYHPALTAIHQPREELSLITCERLINLISDRPDMAVRNRQVVMMPELVIRDSCGASLRRATGRPPAGPSSTASTQ